MKAEKSSYSYGNNYMFYELNIIVFFMNKKTDSLMIYDIARVINVNKSQLC